MGCLLSCFRSSAPDPDGGLLHDPLVRGSRLGDAFLDDDDETKIEARGSPDGDRGGVDEELRREAAYLRSCGAISETPPEILNGSNQLTADDTCECNDPSNGAQVIKVQDNFSEGFTCDEHASQNSDESTEHLLAVESEPQSSLKDKSSCQNNRNQRPDSSDSPYPTPLVLRGDMETPYTAYNGTLKTGKRSRTSKQFIYPVLRPIENKLQWMELRDDSSPVLPSNPPKRRYLSADSSENPQQTITGSMATNSELMKSASFPFHDMNAEQGESKSQSGNQQILDDGEQSKHNPDSAKIGAASLSYWLKSSSADGGIQSDTEGKVVKQTCYENSVFTDVPIFTAFGLNWDNDEPTPVMPKAWDGNGIPNTTTKYKEDQKVSWHATPFEERLLKVLSDEKPHHERKLSGKLIQLDEGTD